MYRLFTKALRDSNMQMLDRVPRLLYTKEELEWREWISEYAMHYQEYPTPERLHQEFSGFIATTPANDRGLLETVMSERKSWLTNQFIVEASSLDGSETRERVRELSLQLNAMPTNVMSISTGHQFVYQPMTLGKFLVSSKLTELIKGVHPGELVTLIGDSGVGKSILALNTAVQWYLSGMRVLVIAADMKPSMSMVRANAMLLGQDSEEMHLVSDARRNALLSMMQTMPGELYMPKRSPKNVAEINSMIMEYDADAMVLDGTYFMQASFGSRDLSRSWSNITRVSEELKDTAHGFDIPVLSISQTNEEGNVAFSKALFQDSDIVLHASNVELLEAQKAKILNIKVNKNRRGGRVYVNVQVNHSVSTLIDRTSGIVTGSVFK